MTTVTRTTGVSVFSDESYLETGGLVFGALVCPSGASTRLRRGIRSLRHDVWWEVKGARGLAADAGVSQGRVSAVPG